MPEVVDQTLGAVIVAAGSSRRMGFDKLTAPLEGKPLIVHSLAAFQACPEVRTIVLVCPAEREAEFVEYARPFSKVASIVPGGRERVESVLAGVSALSAEAASLVAVHDGARPLITPEAITACYRAACIVGASVSAEPVTDTLHRADERGNCIETVSRQNLWRMQTPQVMGIEVLKSLLETAHTEGGAVTDEISLLIRSGGQARVVENASWNFKVTYPRDLELAEMIFKQR